MEADTWSANFFSCSNEYETKTLSRTVRLSKLSKRSRTVIVCSVVSSNGIVAPTVTSTYKKDPYPW